jgi:putative nucleotidyltransferase with HDIG domain
MSKHDAILDKIKSLPPAPLVLARVLAIMDDPKAGMNDLISAIEIDPGVTANVLRICNSPYYAGKRQLSTLQDAVQRVGMRTVTQLVTMGQAEPLMNSAHEGYGLAPGDLWRHSMAVALACRILATRVGSERVSLAFTGGLLHDIGKIVLDVFLKARYHEVRSKVEAGSPFQEAERIVLGTEHAELGSQMAQRWGFPEPLVRMIGHHHDPEGCQEEIELCSIVHLADALSHWLGIGLGRPGLAVRFDSAAVRRFGFKPEDLDRIMIELVETLEQTEQRLAA